MKMQVSNEFKKLVEDENRAYTNYCNVMEIFPTLEEYNQEVTKRVLAKIESVNVMGGSNEQ